MTSSPDTRIFSTSNAYWAEHAADTIIERFPNETLFTCAAGISPSGVVHFGNFRDVVTSLMVAKFLSKRGKTTRFIFSWDDFDRLRKVPVNVDPSFGKYVGYPLSAIPDPTGSSTSYARHFESEFEQSMKDLGIDLEFRIQTEQYASGRYDTAIIETFNRRAAIADILLRFMSDKAKQEKEIDPGQFRETFYPGVVYSRFSNTDETTILNFDGKNKITYRCKRTKKEETINLQETRIVKLSWKMDWPMRWRAEGVVFEPGGKDHSSPGGSYDVSSVISQEIYGRSPPLFIGYEFVALRGLTGKMSGSSGLAVSPRQLMEIYEPELLLYMYASREPRQAFGLSFDSEVTRQYDEFDAQVKKFHEGQSTEEERAVIRSVLSVDCRETYVPPIPFRQVLALGQIVQWNLPKLTELLLESKLVYEPASIERRLGKARNWIERYNPTEAIALRTEKNVDYFLTLDGEQKAQTAALAKFLQTNPQTVEALDLGVYEIPKLESATTKENSQRQRAFFKDIYMLLLNRETGPRLSTFLWAIGVEKAGALLSF